MIDLKNWTSDNRSWEEDNFLQLIGQKVIKAELLAQADVARGDLSIRKRLVKISSIWYIFQSGGQQWMVYGLDTGRWVVEGAIYGLPIISYFNSKIEAFAGLGLEGIE